MLWSEDYIRYANYLETGKILLVEGAFKSRYNSDNYEFKITKMHLLETVKSTMTKQVVIDVAPQFIDENFVEFIDQNVKAHPGKTTLKFQICDALKTYNLNLYSRETGFTMNDEMAAFLQEHKNLEVSVQLVN
jgi:DNA polymerase-3 subunit alpha